MAADFEQIAVSTSVVQLDRHKFKGHLYALIAVVSNGITFRVDGEDPTASVGTRVGPGKFIKLWGHENMGLFRAIRTSADATLDVIYSDGDIEIA